MMDKSEFRVTPQRFELARSGHTAFIDYRQRNGVLDLLHTEVPAALRGGGVGSELVRAALDWARDQKLKILPSCPFVAEWLERHPQYADLNAE